MVFSVSESENTRIVEDAMAALRARDADRAAALLHPLADNAPADTVPWSALVSAEMMRGDHRQAAAVLDKWLAYAPRNVTALVQRGLLHEKAGHVRAAVSFYQAARNQAAVTGGDDPALSALLAHAARFCAEADRSFAKRLDNAAGAQLSAAMDEAVGLLRGEREIDLQRPSVFYYPGLPQRRFYEPVDFPWISSMLALLPAMRSEWDAISRAGGGGFSPYVQTPENRPSPNNPLLNSPAWTALHFWRSGEIVEENARRCPATMEALSHAPMPRMPGRSPNAHWSRLLPGAHITPHTGMLNTRLICHIPIKTAPGCTLRVGSETRGWEAGVPLIFDDSMEHEARNSGNEERVVLLFEIWRPEIPPEDREAIGRIFDVIGQSGL